MTLTEDGFDMPDVYDLTAEFLRACGTGVPTVTLRLYTLKLLKLLGYLPSAESAPMKISSAFAALLASLDDLSLVTAAIPSDTLSIEIGRFLQGLLGNQLGISLKSPEVRLSISAGVTPNCQ